jgi:arsenate reductase (glutaredoxin)
MTTRAIETVTVLTYSGCQTCRKALRWLRDHNIAYEARAIVDAPPTIVELTAWTPASGLPIRKWLNTSGQSYRAIGKARIDSASDVELVSWLAADGKLVKRPVLVKVRSAAESDAQEMVTTVIVGFSEAAYERLVA